MKFALFCLFIGLPICCGEWNGPFWAQAVAALSCFVPFGIVLLRERRRAYGKNSIPHCGAGQKKGT